MRIGESGRPSQKFQKHLQRYYISFCEQAVRCMFICGFVPWRLRMLSSGDAVPEVIPLGMFVWTIESMPDSCLRRKDENGARRRGHEDGGGRELSNFNKRAKFFASKNYLPYRLPGDEKSSSAASASSSKKPKIAGLPSVVVDDKKKADKQEGSSSSDDDDDADDMIDEEKTESGGGDKRKKIKKRKKVVTLAYEKQMRALQRQGIPIDDDCTKSLRYTIHFTENFNIMEDEVEIYEYIQPNRDVTYHSPMYRTVPSPLAHIINDYRNLRRAIIQREYADTWNSQVISISFIITTIIGTLLNSKKRRPR